jgi:NADH:ubiquinone oxidoreductase subunit F (NADH-binding)
MNAEVAPLRLPARICRVMPDRPYKTLVGYVAAGGGAGLSAARLVSADTIIDEITASGLRGRGGAGFPTGVKWRTIASFASPVLRTSVVINAAEGEPGTFKDRAIMRANPYAPLEGALIAATVFDARTILIATKASFVNELVRLRSAISEIIAAGWARDVEIRIVEGPSEYLYGEETALLEVLDGRPPFPRIAPPFRHGVIEVVHSAADAASGSGTAADIEMAGTQAENVAPPVLVNNLETFANVPAIVARGAAWFRSVGTPESPGSIVCTITGAVKQPGVFEVAMGTRLRDVIDDHAGGATDVTIKAVLVGTSNAALGADQLDTKLSYEAMSAAGSGLGSAGFIVVGDDTPIISVATGVAHFLSIESCGQCTPCKQDGIRIADLLERIGTGQGHEVDLVTVRSRLATVADGARCSLASQQQVVVTSLLDRFEAEVRVQFTARATPAVDHLVAALVDLDEGRATLDDSFASKQPDWTYAASDSAKTPVELQMDHRTDTTNHLIN